MFPDPSGVRLANQDKETPPQKDKNEGTLASLLPEAGEVDPNEGEASQSEVIIPALESGRNANVMDDDNDEEAEHLPFDDDIGLSSINSESEWAAATSGQQLPTGRRVNITQQDAAGRKLRGP